jgi:hypothetical protein
MRYFFHLASEDVTIPDEIGMEAPDLLTAIAGALKSIEEIRDEIPASTSEWSGWRLEITDENGHVLETIVLDLQ